MATPLTRDEAIKRLNEQTSELRKALLKTRRVLNATSADALAHCDLGPTQFELDLIHSFVNDVVKYQNRLEAEYRRRN